MSGDITLHYVNMTTGCPKKIIFLHKYHIFLLSSLVPTWLRYSHVNIVYGIFPDVGYERVNTHLTDKK